MANGIEVVVGVLVLLGVPIVLGGIWLLRRQQHRRRVALELKRGNKIYNEWRRTGIGSPPEEFNSVQPRKSR